MKSLHAFLFVACLTAATPALAQTPLTAHPVGLTPGHPTMELLWGEVFVRLRRPAGATPAVWDKPPAATAQTFDAALPLDSERTVGISVLFSRGVGCDMGENGKNAREQPFVCPGKIAVLSNNTILATADIPKVCVASLMTSSKSEYQTVAALSADKTKVWIAGTANGLTIAGDFSGIKDCTISVPVPR